MMMATCSRCGTLNGWEIDNHHTSCGVLYTIADNVYNTLKEDCAPRNPYPSGYGKKIPTRYMLKYESGKTYEKNHWRRVYVMQFSNAGSAYILIRRTVVFLDSNTEYRLEKM